MKFLRNAILAFWAIGLPLSARAQAPALTTFLVGTTTVTASALTTGRSHIWELVWGPDNFLWMTERGGRISRVDPATGQVQLLLTVPDVTPTGESGLLGMVLHPDFATMPYVYAVYNYTAAGDLKEKLVRFTYSAAANSLTAPQVLLGNIEATTTHSGSRLLILPDRTLLMTTGDAQLQPEAQNRASLNGKILRLNLDGTVPADNPTPGSLVFTLGHRNPQGLVRLPDGRLYSSEHGPSSDDEINKIEVGRNYGWPNVHGNCNSASELTFCAANNVREPLTIWTPTIAPAGLAYYDHPAIPGWRGNLLLATLKHQRLVQLPLNPAGDAITARIEFLTNEFGRLRAICVAPNGKVYLGTSNGFNDRIIILENRAYVATGTRAASDFSFDLFPNPSRRQATVQLPKANALLTLRDLVGRTVLTLRAAGTTATLDLSNLRPGTYLLQAQTAAGSATRQMVVE
ncbi:PQQ-dependent sugar dehydrogenase [Hymenobacter sp. BT683]|uniref:PQQ-dependent sugar dehydrogenase n=1 Tax=Hymenobacter jeongseonensis TaxID=2791027 RepID=A0ABS0IJF6_9BACT|nr:PQQ-dependent sugar dehydrogenase [Hymenobacter jeongseonensis]MBF9238518.1 PQQ-dependent sugar dehydrogenase [Hymenobacter jeongseonensis]